MKFVKERFVFSGENSHIAVQALGMVPSLNSGDPLKEHQRVPLVIQVANLYLKDVGEGAQPRP